MKSRVESPDSAVLKGADSDTLPISSGQSRRAPAAICRQVAQLIDKGDGPFSHASPQIVNFSPQDYWLPTPIIGLAVLPDGTMRR
jgi:hypothetical protein